MPKTKFQQSLRKVPNADHAQDNDGEKVVARNTFKELNDIIK